MGSQASRAALAAVLLALACSGLPGNPPADPPQGTALPLARSGIDEFLRAHNAWRSRVGVRPVRWSARLAADAQAWADVLAGRGCRLEHAGSIDEGENLFFAGPLRAQGREGAVAPFTPTEIVDAWGGEAKDYSYARNACVAGRRCAHYVQIVWRTTEEIGCAGAVCANRGQIWVCRYRPGSIEGKLPY